MQQTHEHPSSYEPNDYDPMSHYTPARRRQIGAHLLRATPALSEEQIKAEAARDIQQIQEHLQTQPKQPEFQSLSGELPDGNLEHVRAEINADYMPGDYDYYTRLEQNSHSKNIPVLFTHQNESGIAQFTPATELPRQSNYAYHHPKRVTRQ